MSITVSNAIIHQVISNPLYESDSGQLAFIVQPAQELHPVNEQMQKLCVLIEKRMQQVGRGSSKFKDPNQISGAPLHFSNLVNEEEGFLEFTLNLAGRLVAKMPVIATDSYIAFIDYVLDSERFLIVCALKLEDGVTIDSGDMTVIDATSIQKKNIHEGAKIIFREMDQHIQGEDCIDYIVWIKTGVSKKLSNYFQDLFEIDTYIDNQEKTTKFKKALDTYIESTVESSSVEGLDKTVIKQKIRENAYEYINTVAQSFKELDFDEVNKITDSILTNNEIEPEMSFIEHINEYHDDIPNFFKPFSGATKNWGKVKTTVSNSNNKKIQLTIDREILTDKDYIEIDSEKNEITIKQLNETFIKDL